MHRTAILSGLAVLLLTAEVGWSQPPEKPEVLPVPAADAPVAAPLVDFEPVSGPSEHFWFRSEYLVWWVKDQPLPAALVIGPFDTLTITDLVKGGIYKKPINIGGDQTAPPRHGGRFSAGYWLDRDQIFGVEANYFFTGQQSINESAMAPAGAQLASPLPVTFAPPQVTLPGVGLFIVGGPGSPALATVDLSSSFQGAEANGIVKLFSGNAVRLSLLGGFRWLELDETLLYTATSRQAQFVSAGQKGINFFSSVATTTGAQPFTLSDLYATKNRFYGGQVGTRLDGTAGRWDASATGKVAFGSMRQSVEISGANNAFTNFVPSLAQGGIFAQPPNLGQFTRTVAAVSPEVGLNVGYRLTEALHASLGYSLLYVNKVVRPGDQMQTNLDVTPIFTGRPGVNVTQPKLFQTTDFWAQGLSFGLELRY